MFCRVKDYSASIPARSQFSSIANEDQDSPASRCTILARTQYQECHLNNVPKLDSHENT